MRSNYQHTHSDRRAYTLAESMVVLVLVSLLVAILFPLLDAARINSRRIACSNNLKNLALSVCNYDSNFDCLPPTWLRTYSGSLRSDIPWSPNVRLLGFLEQSFTAKSIDYLADVSDQYAIDELQISTFRCPGDDTTVSSQIANMSVWPSNYAFNSGVWMVYDTRSRKSGSGVFHPDTLFRTKDVSDGLSTTMLASEVLSHGKLKHLVLTGTADKFPDASNL